MNGMKPPTNTIKRKYEEKKRQITGFRLEIGESFQQSISYGAVNYVFQFSYFRVVFFGLFFFLLRFYSVLSVTMHVPSIELCDFCSRRAPYEAAVENG